MADLGTCAAISTTWAVKAAQASRTTSTADVTVFTPPYHWPFPTNQIASLGTGTTPRAAMWTSWPILPSTTRYPREP